MANRLLRRVRRFRRSEARWHHLGRYRCSGAGYVECRC
ncbi:hypothetical protein ACLB1R_07055 [Escherichia coli]